MASLGRSAPQASGPHNSGRGGVIPKGRSTSKQRSTKDDTGTLRHPRIRRQRFHACLSTEKVRTSKLRANDRDRTVPCRSSR